jgi:hypothetical protein
LTRWQIRASGVFLVHRVLTRSVIPSDKRPSQTQALQAIAEPLEVLFHAVLHHLGPVPDVA